jgi:hypothetical protein
MKDEHACPSLPNFFVLRPSSFVIHPSSFVIRRNLELEIGSYDRTHGDGPPQDRRNRN